MTQVCFFPRYMATPFSFTMISLKARGEDTFWDPLPSPSLALYDWKFPLENVTLPPFRSWLDSQGVLIKRKTFPFFLSALINDSPRIRRCPYQR